MKYTLHIAFNERIGDLLLQVHDRISQFGSSEIQAYSPLLFSQWGEEGFRVTRPDWVYKAYDNIAHLVNWRAGYQLGWESSASALLEDAEDISTFFEKEYISNVTVDNPFDPELHLMLYVPLYDFSAVQCVEKIIKNLPESYKIIVNVVAIPYDVAEAAKLVQARMERNNRNIVMRKSMYYLEKLNKSTSLFRYIIFFQNRNVDGWSINYDEEKIVATCSDIAIFFIANFHEVAKLVEDGKCVLAINSQSFVLDVFHAFNQWLRNLVEDESRDYIIEENKDDESTAKAILKIVLQKEAQIIKDFISTLDMKSHEYTLEELRELFKTNCEEKIKQAIEEELKGKPLSVRVQLFKRFKNILTLKGNDTEEDLALALDQDRLFIENLELSEDIKQAYAQLEDYLQQIKHLRVQIENGENEIEVLKDQLNEEDYQYVNQVDEGVQLGNKIFKPNKVVNRPLAETFIPEDSVESLPSAIDLRSYFASIKNQGQQGACTAFSTVSVFEYFIKRMTGQDVDLSEAFTYYNSRKKAGDEDKDCGASFNHVFDAVMESGFCLEELCPYNETVYDKVPSDASYADGKERRVSEVKNVRLDLQHIKSALAKGLPILIGVSSFQSMKKLAGGYVCFDQHENNESSDSSHAMVVCGYSDAKGYFIVRNSWGIENGDQGYCYFPYEAFRHPNVINGCYVITGINDSALESVVSDADRIDRLDGHNNTEKYEIIRNILLEKKRELEQNRKNLSHVRFEYSKLCKRLGENDVSESGLGEIDKQIAALKEKKNTSELEILLVKRNRSLLNSVVINGLAKVNKDLFGQVNTIEKTSRELSVMNNDLIRQRKIDSISFFRKLSPEKFNLNSLLNAAMAQSPFKELIADAKKAMANVTKNRHDLYEAFGELSKKLFAYVLEELHITILDFMEDERADKFFNDINHSAIMAMIEGWVPMDDGQEVIYLTIPSIDPQVSQCLKKSVSLLSSTDIYRITFLHVERYHVEQISLFALVGQLITKARRMAAKAQQEVRDWLLTVEGQQFLEQVQPTLSEAEMRCLVNSLSS